MELTSLILALFLIGANAEKLILSVSNEDTSSVMQCQEKNIISCKKVTINPAARGAATVVFPENKSMTRSGSSQGQTYTYDHEDGSEAILVYGNEGILKASINLYQPDKLYFIHRCGMDCFVLVEETETKNQPKVDSREVDASVQSRSFTLYQLSRLNRLHMDRQGITTVTAFFYYTNAFLAIDNDPQAYIAMLVGNANTGYMNSNLQVRLADHCSEKLDLEESDTPNTNLDNFQVAKGTMAALTGSADIAILVLSEPKSNVCGQAYLRVYQNDLRIGWVGRGCQVTVTGHEVGHMFGAQHNREQFPPTNARPGYPFEYGYLMRMPGSTTPSGFRTIMAYNAAGYRTRLNKFSSPNLFHTSNGINIPTGTPENDNVRTHEENKGVMASLGDESTVCPTDGVTTTSTSSTTAPPTTSPAATTTNGSCADTLPGLLCFLKRIIGLCALASCRAVCPLTCNTC